MEASCPAAAQRSVARPPPHLHDAGQLLHFILPGEQRVARVQLSHDASQAPHVNGHVVGMAQNHLWRSVEPALDVRVHYEQKKEKPPLGKPSPPRSILLQDTLSGEGE